MPTSPRRLRLSFKSYEVAAMKCFNKSVWMTAAALCVAACRTPAASQDSKDTGDGGLDGGVRPPCAANVNPDLGLLPENSPAKGGGDSTVVVVNVFSSFVCPHCARLAETIDTLWADPNWQGRVRLYFRHVPVSATLHAAATAAFNQGEDKFWALHDEIYYRLRENGEYMTMAAVRTFADEVLALDMIRFDADLVSDETAARLAADKEIADALGVTGTPSVFVCDEKIATSDLEEVVSEYLQSF